MHAVYAAAIEATPPGGGAAAASRLVELAHHWTAANRPGPALTAAVAAGDASLAVVAYAEAARQYEHAIASWDLVDPADRPSGRDLGDLYLAAGSAALLIGDTPRAVSLSRHAVDILDDGAGSGDVERRALARCELGMASGMAGDTAMSIRMLEEAVALLEGAPPSRTQARALAGLAANLMLAGRSAESVAFAERAIEMARAVDDLVDESRATNILGVDLANLGEIARGIELLRRAVQLAEAAEDPAAIPSALINLSSVLEIGGFAEAAFETSVSGAATVRRTDREHGFGTFLEVNAAALAIELGRYDDAAELLDRNVPGRMPGVGTVQSFATRANLGAADRRPVVRQGRSRRGGGRGEGHRRRPVRHRHRQHGCPAPAPRRRP